MDLMISFCDLVRLVNFSRTTKLTKIASYFHPTPETGAGPPLFSCFFVHYASETIGHSRQGGEYCLAHFSNKYVDV